MEKFLQWINFLFNCFINTCMLFALFIVVLYFVWGVTPQTVIQKGGYFFSESWKIITGQQREEKPFENVSEKQLEEAKGYIHYRGR